MVANDLIMIDISVIVPLFNERESLPELCEWVDRVMKEHSFTYEMILVDDGSTDGSWECVKELAAANSNIHGIQFRRNYGKSAALYCGFERAEGGTVITMDADLQDSPDEIPELYRMINVDDYDVVSGWKQHRQDNKLTKNLPSKLYNATARMITGIKLHDMNCGLKAYKNEVVKYFKEEMLPKLKLEEVYLKDNVSYIEEKLNECFCDIKVEFIWYTFTNKEYNGNAIENGRYKTLLITIGKGLGSNWWGSVFDESLKYESTEVISYKWYFEKYINGWN